jgi:hypothetical protein
MRRAGTHNHCRCCLYLKTQIKWNNMQPGGTQPCDFGDRCPVKPERLDVYPKGFPGSS